MTTDNAADQQFTARLQECVELDEGHVTVGAHAVNQAMISMWADALIDDNPIYVDDAAARAAGRTGIVAPATMIQAWLMPSLSRMARAQPDVPGLSPYLAKGGTTDGSIGQSDDAPPNVYAVLAERGFVNSLATNCRQVYHREVQPGDHVRCISTVDAVSGLKHTAMGTGHFLTTRMDYLDQKDREVATQYWTVLRYRENSARAPSEKAAPDKDSKTPPKQSAKTAQSGAPLTGAPQVGQWTEPSVFPITAPFVICTAIATHDFYPIHHDVDWARSIGQPDIFTNILTTTGLVGGVMTKWAGPKVRLRSVDLRLLAPNFPGDELTLQGEVTAIEGEEVTMTVKGVNRLGMHVDAVVKGLVPPG